MKGFVSQVHKCACVLVSQQPTSWWSSHRWVIQKWFSLGPLGYQYAMQQWTALANIGISSMHLMHPKLIWYLWTFSILINKHSFEIWVLYWLDIVKLTIIFLPLQCPALSKPHGILLSQGSHFRHCHTFHFQQLYKMCFIFFSPQHQCLRVLHLLKRLSSLALPIFMPWMVASSSSILCLSTSSLHLSSLLLSSSSFCFTSSMAILFLSLSLRHFECGSLLRLPRRTTGQKHKESSRLTRVRQVALHRWDSEGRGLHNPHHMCFGLRPPTSIQPH